MTQKVSFELYSSSMRFVIYYINCALPTNVGLDFGASQSPPQLRCIVLVALVQQPSLVGHGVTLSCVQHIMRLVPNFKGGSHHVDQGCALIPLVMTCGSWPTNPLPNHMVQKVNIKLYSNSTRLVIYYINCTLSTDVGLDLGPHIYQVSGPSVCAHFN